MRFPRKRGATSVKSRVFIPDNTSATGAGCTGLSSTSTNLAICYSRENDVGGTEVTGANLLAISTIGTWADPTAGKLRFGAVDGTKLPGLYEIHFPDAAAFGTSDASQSIVINVYEKTTTALKIGPNMVLIPLSSMTVLDGEANSIQFAGQTITATAGVTFPTGTVAATTTAMTLATSQPNYAPAKAGDSMSATNAVTIVGGQAVNTTNAVTLAANQAVNATNTPTVASMLAGGVFGTSNAPTNFSSAVISAGGIVDANVMQVTGTPVELDTAIAHVSDCPTVPAMLAGGVFATSNAPATFQGATFPSGTVAATTTAMTLATSQPNYAPAKAGDSMSATNAVTIVGGQSVNTTNAVTLATSQPNYAPARAGDNMSTTNAVTIVGGQSVNATNAPSASQVAACTAATVTADHGAGSYTTPSLAGVATEATVYTRLAPSDLPVWRDSISGCTAGTLNVQHPGSWGGSTDTPTLAQILGGGIFMTSNAPANFSSAMITSSGQFVVKGGTSTATAYDISNSTDTPPGVATIQDRLGAWAGTGVETVLGALTAIASKSASGTPTEFGTFSPSTDSLEALRDVGGLNVNTTNAVAVSDSSVRDALGMASANLDAQLASINSVGSGARSVVITVNDGTNPLENAKIRLTSGAESYVLTTDATGVVTFALDDASWSVVITKAMYEFTETVLVVSGDTTQTYSMSSTGVIAASDPGFVTGYLYCYDSAGAIEDEVAVELKLYCLANGKMGMGISAATRTKTSNVAGLVEFVNLLPGATYMIRRGDRAGWEGLGDGTFTMSTSDHIGWRQFTIPAATTSPYEMPSVWGTD